MSGIRRNFDRANCNYWNESSTDSMIATMSSERQHRRNLSLRQCVVCSIHKYKYGIRLWCKGDRHFCLIQPCVFSWCVLLVTSGMTLSHVHTHYVSLHRWERAISASSVAKAPIYNLVNFHSDRVPWYDYYAERIFYSKNYSRIYAELKNINYYFFHQ